MGGNNGTAQSGVTVNSTGIGGTSAFNFDGSSSAYVDVGDKAALEVSPLSVFAWINTNNASHDEGIVSKDNGGSNSWSMRINNGAGDEYYILVNAGGSNAQVGSGFVPSSNTWYHVGFTFDESTITAFVDGEKSGTTSLSGSIDYGTDPVRIGWFRDSGRLFDGEIDDVRIYDHALSPIEVRYLYELGRAPGRVKTGKSTL